MGADGNHTEPDNGTNKTRVKVNRWQYIRAAIWHCWRIITLFFCWLSRSISDPHNLPHYLTFLATMTLAIFAYYAWSESTKSTAALLGQVTEMQRQSELTAVQLKPKLTMQLKTGGACPQGAKDINGKPISGTIITPVWRNNGITTAAEYWGWDSDKFFDTDAPKTFDFVNPTVPLGDVVKVAFEPSKDEKDFRLQYSRCISDENVKMASTDHGKIVMWGYVEYRDALPGNKEHHIHWCYQVFPIDRDIAWIFSFSLYRGVCNISD